MALDKVYLRDQVKKGIAVMPSNGTIIRSIPNSYREISYYGEVVKLTGLLYSNNSPSIDVSTYQDKGISEKNLEKLFLIDYSEDSTKMKNNDLIFFENGQAYKIKFIDENFEVYLQAELESIPLKYDEDFIVDENNSTIAVMKDLPEEFWEDINNGLWWD